jgi:mitofusin
MQSFHQSSSSRPATPDSPRFEKESHIGSDLAVRQMREEADNVLKEYEAKQAR